MPATGIPWPSRSKEYQREYRRRQRKSPAFKEKDRLVAAQRREKHPEKVRAAYKRWEGKNPEQGVYRWLRRKYGLTIEQRDAMRAAQEGCCAICGAHESLFKKALHIDHCHTTGKIRALLCVNCNKGLGSFKDNPDALRKAAAYLEHHKA